MIGPQNLSWLKKMVKNQATSWTGRKSRVTGIPVAKAKQFENGIEIV